MSLTALIFLFAFAAGCLMALIRHPIYGLLTYIGTFYLHPPSRWWGQGILEAPRWALIAAGVTVLALLLRSGTAPIWPLVNRRPMWVFLLFVVWIAVQSLWALDPLQHSELLEMYLKFFLVIILICGCIDSERYLRWFLWSHVLGCFYLGWIALDLYTGGRFEGFGGPGIGEANAGALQIVTGILSAGTLFLVSRGAARVGLLGLIPVIVNGLVTTISRSGFLGVTSGGLVYNFFTPGRYRKRVRYLSVLAVVLFLMLTGPTYWTRVESIKYVGQEVEGVETGAKRLLLIQKQWLMAQRYPLGCGHMCTTVLSPSYLGEEYLSQGGRASHNTFMTMLVDHGIPGAIFYVGMLIWTASSLLLLRRRLAADEGFLGAALPAVAGSLGAIAVADLFVQYPKFEARFWFVALLLVMLQMTAPGKAREPPA